MSRHMTERTTVRLPDSLVRRAKAKAAAEGRTLTALIEEGLRRIISEPMQRTKEPRVLPRVSVARGGLMPGIDLDSAALQEIEDVERFGHSK
jgi:hypothetical protein